MSRLRGLAHSVFHDYPVRRPNCVVTEQRKRPDRSPQITSSGAQVCSGVRLDLKRVASARPSVPTLLRHLPTNSTPSSRPDTSRRPGDLPWRASCRRGAVDRPGTLWVHRRMPDCERVRENVIRFLALFDHGHVPGRKILELLLLGGRFGSDDFKPGSHEHALSVLRGGLRAGAAD
jgi:hypothetical protein